MLVSLLYSVAEAVPNSLCRENIKSNLVSLLYNWLSPLMLITSNILYTVLVPVSFRAQIVGLPP